jgi:ABC-type glycerol-3-phosphate transport system substrate-binding protein
MKTSPFQIILIGVFILIFFVAIIVFSRSVDGNDSSSTTAKGTVRIWGTFPKEIINPLLGTAINNTQSNYRIEYEEIEKETFVLSFIRALADRNPPDLLFVDNEIYAQVRDKLYTIPYESLTIREYQSTYIDTASIFLEKEGARALPVAIDPLVLYYNKDLLAGQNYLIPPTTWGGLVQAIPRFLRRDANRSIAQNAVALGETANIPHYKKILSALFLQSGVPIVQKSAEGKLFANLGTEARVDGGIPPGEEVLDFYTSFANTANAHFNWARSLPSADEFFLSGASAFYIAPASELFTLQERNPNLNFDIAPLFQVDGAVRPATYGTLYGIGTVAESTNFITAYTVMSALSTDAFVTELTNALTLAPVRRSLLLQAQTDRHRAIMYQVAPNTFSWLDPNPKNTDTAMTEAITGMLRGALNANSALGRLQSVFSRIQ